MAIMADAVAGGMRVAVVCAAVGVSVRRYDYWRTRAADDDYERRRKGAHVRPYNALTPIEAETVRRAVARADWADMSCRELSVRIMHEYGEYVSHVSIWNYERSISVAGHRGKRRRKGPRPLAPNISVSGPNQIWSWDITKLRSDIPGRFWYLFAVLDIWSRKVVSWYISEREDSATAKVAWDAALVGEGFVGTPGTMPKSLSDRGTQMRSQSTTAFFRRLAIAQLFARPRTPDDNPFIESLFATTKMHPSYPGYFQTREDAEAWCREFFRWYNGEHLHSGIGMVTPEEKHNGEWVRIQQERDTIKTRTRTARREYAASLRDQIKEPLCAIS